MDPVTSHTMTIGAGLWVVIARGRRSAAVFPDDAAAA
jgi:hypothetical protein